MGEFQYSRYPASEWEQEILKMKAGGVTIVSTYVFWIHHEEIEGHFDWSGQRDLRRFVELAGKHGMLVWVRVGPWDHGEVRNGGLPDWLLQKCATRENDPAYLKYVARFYGEIGRQLKGLFWKDGGPIAGVQIENEYHLRGPGKGEEHILNAETSGAGCWHGRAVLHHHRLGRCRCALAGRDPGLRRLSGWFLVPLAYRTASESHLFLLADPMRRKRGRRSSFVAARYRCPVRLVPVPHCRNGRRHGAVVSSPAC